MDVPLCVTASTGGCSLQKLFSLLLDKEMRRKNANNFSLHSHRISKITSAPFFFFCNGLEHENFHDCVFQALTIGLTEVLTGYIF